MPKIMELPTDLTEEYIGKHICKDFDGDCFSVDDKGACQRGGEVTVDGIDYITPPADGICPFIQGL